MRFLRAGLVTLVLLVTTGLCTSCNTPTLPIPPPPPMSYSLTCPDTTACPIEPSGIVTITARATACPEHVPFLMVFNESTTVGAYSARLPDLTFSVRIAAAGIDYLDLACMATDFTIGLKTTPELVSAVCVTP